MNVANCTKCGKVFQRTNSPYCPACFQDSVTHVSQVYRYIQARPEVNIDQVADALQIPVKEIEQMLFEGKLGTAASHLKSQCRNCELPIIASRGHFCAVCAEKLDQLAKQVDKAEEEKPAQMHSSRRVDDDERHGFSSHGNKLFYPDMPKTDNKPAGSQPYGFKRVSDD